MTHVRNRSPGSADRQAGRFAWVLRGTVVARGPDCEPLLADVEPIGLLDVAVLAEAAERYTERFEVGRMPE